MRTLGILPAIVCLASLTGAAPAPDPLEELTRARAAEALDLTERAGGSYWPTLKVDRLALLVIDPGHGALLFNHPSPPAPFTPAGTVVRHRPPPKDPDDPIPAETPTDHIWSVHQLPESAVAPYMEARSSFVIAGRRTARVMRDEVAVPRSPFGGMPPSEAVIGRIMGALFLAHLDDREGEPATDPWKAAYTADAEDLSLIALEQRILAWTLRITYTEKTMDRYRRLAAEWLAVRRARLARSPQAVALEESIERREGLADYSETLASRILDDPGRESREDLEKVDPFFERYANLFALRVNTLNYPLTWYPATPEEARRRARSTGAALAGVIWPMRVRWNMEFFGAQRPERRTLREAIEVALKEGKPEIPDTDADLFKAAAEREGLEEIRALMKAAERRRLSR